MDGLSIRTKMGPVERTESLTKSNGASPVGSNKEVGGSTFADTLKKAVDNVDSLQKDADVKMQQLVTGKSDNIHDTMIAAEKADIALKLMVQIRNKMIDAYQEVMKMQV